MIAVPEMDSSSTTTGPTPPMPRGAVPDATDKAQTAVASAPMQPSSDPRDTTKFNPFGARELLELSGIDESHWQQFVDGEPLGASDEESLLKVLYRVRNFKELEIARWTNREWPVAEVVRNVDLFRGQMFSFWGQLRRVTVHRPPPEVVRRYGMEEYFLCEIELGTPPWTAAVATTRIPSLWKRDAPLNERVSAEGLLLKTGTRRHGNIEPVFAAKRVAWHPDEVTETVEGEGVNLGMTVLGDLGMDVGLFDDVENRQPITARDRECFYQLLWAVGQGGTQQLMRYARANLESRKDLWRAERARLMAQRQQVIQQQQVAEPEQIEPLEQELARIQKSLAILHASLKAAEEGRFSVVPLFNRPERQQGRLVLLEGNARRAVEVRLGGRSPAGENNVDIVERFGIDRYWEIEIFTEDSQNNPIVVCAGELPPGFPTGEDINEAVRVGGFYFKTWAYLTQRGAGTGPDGARRTNRRFAPLLIAKQPIWIKPPESSRSPLAGAIAGGLFVAALLGMWIWQWRSGRGDEKFQREVIARKYQIEEGTSLNDLGIEAEEGPDFSHLP